MAMASTPATHIRCNSPRILPSFIPGSNLKYGKVFPWNAASNYVKLQVGSGGFPAKPLVRKPWMKRATILRCATTEEIEAEKSLIEKDAKGRMEKAIETLRSNFMSIRTGRANPAMLDRVEVEYYGTPVTLKSIAQISTPNASSIMVQPYDKSSLKAIEKAIVSSDLGLTPNNDGDVIRLTLPQLTSERRKKLSKIVAKQAEEGKVAIRNIRRHAIKSYEKLEKVRRIPLFPFFICWCYVNVRIMDTTYLHIDMILSTLGLSPHGFAVGFYPIRLHTNRNIVHTYKLMILPTSSQCGTLVTHPTILPLNKGPPSLPSTNQDSPLSSSPCRSQDMSMKIWRVVPDSRTYSIQVNSSSPCWGQDTTMKHPEHTTCPNSSSTDLIAIKSRLTTFIRHSEEFIHMAKSGTWL